MIALALFAALLATPATFDAQVKVAKPGDTVVLGPGSYPLMQIIGRDGLTLDAHGATMAGVVARNVTNFALTGGDYRPAGPYGAVYVIGSSHVRVSDIASHDAGLANAVTFRDSTDVGIAGAVLDGPKVGVVFGNVSGGAARNVAVMNELGDGIDIADSHGIVAEFNTCLATVVVNDRHADCVQMWSVAGHTPTSDVVVRFNLAWGHTQGFTGFDHAAGGFDRIVIEGNTVAADYPQAIALQASRASAVRNNTTLTLPGAPFRATINADGALRCGNSIGAGAGKPAIVEAPCAATP